MKQLNRISALVVVGLGLATIASAEDKGTPWHVELGAYFPTFSIPGVSKDTGATFGLGYTFTKNGASKTPAAFGLELRGNAFRASDIGGSADVSISQFLGNVEFSTPDNKLFYGIHLGFGKASISSGNVTISDDKSRFIYGAQVGYNFSTRVYGTVRYSHCSEEGYRGVGVGVGYRF